MPSAPARTRRKPAAGRRRFVVHEHEARRHHFDLRLELGGVLKSWALPKGPSLNPADKRLAVEVEDHALAYADFEGVIPPGEYGAGRVAIWDRGTWAPVGEADPETQLRKGDLSFRLEGRRLRGEFHLTRLRKRGRTQDWLVIKKRDEYADRAFLRALGRRGPTRLRAKSRP